MPDHYEECHGTSTMALFAGKKGDFKHCKEKGIANRPAGTGQFWTDAKILALIGFFVKLGFEF